MGQSINSGVVSAVIAGGVSVSGTPIGVLKALVGGAGTLGTVPAGKTWYIVGASITSTMGELANSDNSGYGTILANGVPILSQNMRHKTVTGCLTLTTNSSINLSAPAGFSFPVAQNLTVTATDTSTVGLYVGRYTVWYVEV